MNLTKNKVISRRPVFAKNLITRGRGMIGRDFSNFDAMVFESCKSIHTMFMTIKIDVMFADKENSIIKIKKGLTPWKPLIRCGKAFTVIELAEGTIEKTNTEIGDKIDLNAELSGAEIEKKMQEGLLSAAGTVVTCKESK